jgi:hypothetical protein
MYIEGRGQYHGTAGSGGGGEKAGSGGGLVSLRAAQKMTLLGSNLSALGGNGQYSNGGGSGGTVYLESYALEGDSEVVVRGGLGGSLSGSGGGG